MKKKWILFNAAIVVAGFLAAFFIAAMQVQQQYRSEFTRRLDTALSILTAQADEIKAAPETSATRIGDQLSSAGQQMRISIIDENGKVVGDSSMEDINQNHKNRPEIVQARE
ncbi:MAG TPA: PAS domain-containing sensor histidine kinase, partial [Ruminococcaceae bacterium]|nr:PAS domain-containing sensor histidine kinase [Oscillospiraceae bacterium]